MIERRRAQAELGWTASFNHSGDALVLAIIGPTGEPVRGLSLSGTLHHPDSQADCALEFSQDPDGLYRAVTDCRQAGRWRARIANTGSRPFEAEYELWLP